MVEVAIASVEAVFDWKAYLKEEFGYEFEEDEERDAPEEEGLTEADSLAAPENPTGADALAEEEKPTGADAPAAPENPTGADAPAEPDAGPEASPEGTAV